MMQAKALEAFNKEIFDNQSKKYDYFYPGFFNDNHLLFVGIAPNRPSSKKFERDMMSVQQDPAVYEEKLLETPCGEFLMSICGSTKHVSFTNLLKFATADYAKVSDKEIQEQLGLLDKQLFLVNPNLIVVFGKFVGAKFGLEKFFEFEEYQGFPIVMVPHHSFVYRLSDDEAKQQIKKIISVLDKWLSMHAIVRVTSSHVYWRDSHFWKRSFNNDAARSFNLLESDRVTGLKSFDGRNLEKSSDPFLVGTFEGHLKKRDIWQYDNYGNFSYSKCPRVMYFDIETDFCNDVLYAPKPLTSIAWFDSFDKKYHCFVFNCNKQKIDHDKFDVKEFDSEKQMLHEFFEKMQVYDVISGWYSDKFDLPYLFNRAAGLGVNVDLFFEYFKIDQDGKDIRISQEPLAFYDCKEFFVKTMTYLHKPPSNSLDDVAQFISNGKLAKLKHSGVDVLWRENINGLIEYNVHDVELLKYIAEEKNLLDYAVKLQQICPQNFENSFYNSKTIENLLHHEYWQKHVYFPTKTDHTKPAFKGADVIEPKAGLHKNVVVFDFSAMYTSIYLSLNCSPDTLVGDKEDVIKNFKSVKKDLLSRIDGLPEDMSVNDLIFITHDFGTSCYLPQTLHEGILPKLENKMLHMRKDYQKLRDKNVPGTPEYELYDELQAIAKTIMNSIYGVTGYSKFILFNPTISSSITSVGRQLFQWSCKVIKDNGFEVLYGDTDGLHVKFSDNLSFNGLMLEAERLQKILNNSFNSFMATLTANEQVINSHCFKVEFEKVFTRIVYTSAKKRYFGTIKMWKGTVLEKEELKVTGFETRRNDTPDYFKQLLAKTYLMLLEDDWPEKIMSLQSQAKQEVERLPIESLLIRVKLSRDMDMYEKTIPMHLRALKNSGAEIRRGEYVNMLFIKSIDEKKGVIHWMNDTGDLKASSKANKPFEIDFDKYFEKFFIAKVTLVYPNARRILIGQKTLGGWC